MQVKDIMTKDPAFIGPYDSITAAARKMKEIDRGALPVGDNPKDNKVKDSITSEVHSC